MQLMAERDKLKKEKRFSEYKKLRNKKYKSGEKRKKDYFQKLIEREKKYFDCVACSKIHLRKGASLILPISQRT